MGFRIPSSQIQIQIHSHTEVQDSLKVDLQRLQLTRVKKREFQHLLHRERRLRISSSHRRGAREGAKKERERERAYVHVCV